MRSPLIFALLLSLVGPVAAGDPSAAAAPPPDAPWLADRGPGVRTSIFGTYVRARELLVSPFFEYYLDDDYEYKPAELGHGLEEDFRGRFRASEGLVFLAYGFNDRLALELEAAVIRARLEKASDDPSTMPPELKESGQGDWQAQLDWTILLETAGRPEVFGFLEVVPPSNRKRLLIGTQDWEYKMGAGVTRATSWGTWTLRAALEYADALDSGEYAIEYLKRLSPRWRLYAGIEGVQDEVELIGEAQWHVSERAYFRFNAARGLTAKATDWAPDVGVVVAFPTGAR